VIAVSTAWSSSVVPILSSSSSTICKFCPKGGNTGSSGLQGLLGSGASRSLWYS